MQVILLLIFSLSFGKVLRSAPDIAKAYARFAMRSEMVDSYRLIHSVNQDMVAIKIQLDYLPPHLKVLETKATVVVVVLKLERGIGIYNHFVLKCKLIQIYLHHHYE